MKLTPMDIKNKEFKKGLRGYSIDEVDDFIEELFENYEGLYKENSRLKESLNVSNEKNEHYSKIEATIQNTLILAQNAADQAKQTSEKQAELILSNANDTAKKILDKAHNDVVSINDEYEKVKEEFIKFRAKFRGFMNTQLQTFDELEKDLIKNYNVSTIVEAIEETTEEVEAEIKKIEPKEFENLDDDMQEIKTFFANN